MLRSALSFYGSDLLITSFFRSCTVNNISVLIPCGSNIPAQYDAVVFAGFDRVDRYRKKFRCCSKFIGSSTICSFAIFIFCKRNDFKCIFLTRCKSCHCIRSTLCTASFYQLICSVYNLIYCISATCGWHVHFIRMCSRSRRHRKQ